MVTLQNEVITAEIDPKGAELQSLLHNNGIEYMWNGNPAFWGKHSPVLFPIVGTLKDDTYYFEGKTYQLPRHGFARDMTFASKQVSKEEAVFTLKDNPSTKKVYPFAFVLKLHYHLRDNRLLCTYEVNNPGKGVLYFSVGGHPAFALPMLKGSNYNDHYLLFSKEEPLVRYKLDNGLIGNETETLKTFASSQLKPSDTAIKLPLSHELFYEDAIVLKHLENHYTTLTSDKHQHGLVFDFTGFPYLGIWAARDAPFVCIEPWCGITDNVGHDKKLEKKEGIIALKPGGAWQRTWSVTCF